MSSKRVNPSEGNQRESGRKRLEIYNKNKINDILQLLSDELQTYNRLIYTNQNQHRRALYFKSAKNMRRYCSSIHETVKDIIEHINEYSYIMIADGLLQACCIIYKAVNHGKNCCKGFGGQLVLGFFVALSSTCLASTTRLIELCMILLQELIPLQQQVVMLGGKETSTYILPNSILSLAMISSAAAIETKSADKMEIEEIDDDMFADYEFLLIPNY